MIHWLSFAQYIVVLVIQRSEAYAARLKNFDQVKSEWGVEYSAHEENNRIVDSELGLGKTEAAIRTLNIFEPLRSALIWDFKEHPRTYFMENANGSRVTESGYRRSWDQMILYLEKVANGLGPKNRFRKLQVSRRMDSRALHGA